MTPNAIQPYEEVSTNATRLEFLSVPTFEPTSGKNVAKAEKSLVKKAIGLLIVLGAVVSALVAVGVFHVGAITPSATAQPTVQLTSAVFYAAFPTVKVTPAHTATKGVLSSLGTISPR